MKLRVSKKMKVQTLSLRPPAISNHLPLKATISDPITGKEVKIYLY